MNLRNIAKGWARHDLPLIAASLSFYVMLSITPLLAVVVGIAGLVAEQSAVQYQIVEQVRHLTGEDAASAMSFLLQNVRGFTARDLFSTVIGLGVVLWGSTNLFLQIQKAFNRIFEVSFDRERYLTSALERYVLAIFMLVGLSLLVVVSLFMEGITVTIANVLSTRIPQEIFNELWQLLRFTISVITISFIFSLLYKFVPHCKVTWLASFKGAVFAALMYGLGTLVVGAYFGTGIASSTFSFVSSLTVVLLWIYFASVILLLGALVARVNNPKENMLPYR